MWWTPILHFFQSLFDRNFDFHLLCFSNCCVRIEDDDVLSEITTITRHTIVEQIKLERPIMHKSKSYPTSSSEETIKLRRFESSQK